MKILLVGNANRGKTEFGVNHKLTNYVPTIGVTIYLLTLDSIELWECNGNNKDERPRDGYYSNTNKALVFADNEKEAQYWIRDILRVIPKCRIIVLSREQNLKKFSNVVPINKDSMSRDDIIEYLVN